jgi:LuxR family maltose regulon positive regulatory protein
MLILQARAYQMRHDVTKSLVTVSEAVHLAEPEGYIRRFVDEGQQMAALLSSLREQQRKRGSTPYLDMLLAAFTQDGTKREEAAVSQHLRTPPALLDPLSGRELEVLHLVEQGASNQEIAERLVLALVTVKRHMTNILSKLGVNSRTQALARARALGLFAGEM